jgi:hypothetical protein
MYRVMWLILTPIFVSLALGLLGIDRVTTLASNPPLAWAIIGVCTVAVFIVSLRAYLMNDEPNDRIERLKRDSKPGWIAVGTLFAALLSGLSCFVVDGLVETAAQYLPGAHRQVAGEVKLVRPQRGRGTCRLYATMSGFAARDEFRTCVQVHLRAAIGPLDLEPGQHVTLHLKDTLLGTVVLRITRDN